MELGSGEEQSIALDAFRRFLETEIASVVAPRRDAIGGLWKVVEVVIDGTLAPDHPAHHHLERIEECGDRGHAMDAGLGRSTRWTSRSSSR